MSSQELLNKIKTRAYWRVEIRPTVYDIAKLHTRRSMSDLIEQATVSLRGWPYPYHERKETNYDGRWLEGSIDWTGHKEHWRLYESGQWLHFLGMHTAWFSREELFANRAPLPPDHEGFVHVRDTLYTVTEIMRFAVSMAERGVLDPLAHVSIQLHNSSGYVLYESFNRFFPNKYVNASERSAGLEWTLPADRLRSEADGLAVDLAVRIFSVFGWDPSEAQIRGLAEDQSKLIERRLLS